MTKLWQISVVILAFFLSTQAVFAAPVDANTTFRVVNVSSSDTAGLNVRDYPADAPNLANTKIVGHLSWQATGIITSGLVLRFSGSTWRQIRLGSIIGWVNEKYLEAETSQQNSDQLPEKIICSGTEPFWTLRISKSSSTYDGTIASTGEWLEGEKLDFIARNKIANRSTATWAVTVRRKSASQYITTLISKTDNYCSDGMSDRDYPYQAILLSGNVPVPMQGCCQRDIGR